MTGIRQRSESRLRFITLTLCFWVSCIYVLLYVYVYLPYIYIYIYSSLYIKSLWTILLLKYLCRMYTYTIYFSSPLYIHMYTSLWSLAGVATTTRRPRFRCISFPSLFTPLVSNPPLTCSGVKWDAKSLRSCTIEKRRFRVIGCAAELVEGWRDSSSPPPSVISFAGGRNSVPTEHSISPFDLAPPLFSPAAQPEALRAEDQKQINVRGWI